ncbi:MAG: cytidine deaminase [Patescibacteria group bacterium]
MNNNLLDSAKKAALMAYSPYSNFPVGAAVETTDGEIFLGCNIANASTPLGICAERAAIYNAIINGKRNLKRIAVTCTKGDPEIPQSLMPCGACRQVMAEFMDSNAEIIVDGVGTFTLEQLLPSPFKFIKKTE